MHMLAKPHRIVLAEDHTILREGVKAIFAHEPDLAVVGEAADGREAVQRCAEYMPDLLVLDLSMPRTHGFEALAEVKRVSPKTRVLVLTVHKAEEYVCRAIDGGADGYVLKDSGSAELLFAVRRVVAGERYVCPQVTTPAVRAYLDGKGSGAPRTTFDELTTREREVLKLVAEGFRSRQIGDYLCISEKTVEKHRASLMQKLGITNVSGLTAYAMEKGLITR